jgi:hypothetical protein
VFSTQAVSSEQLNVYDKINTESAEARYYSNEMSLVMDDSFTIFVLFAIECILLIYMMSLGSVI